MPIRQVALPLATQVRYASGKPTKKAGSKKAEKKKKKLPKQFKSYKPSELPQFSICDAIRYLPVSSCLSGLGCSVLI